MIGYAAEEIFSSEEKLMLELAQRMVLLAPYEIGGECVRCHELARAVATLLGIRAQVSDGWYGQLDHSWIWTTPREEWHSLPNVLDVYTPGRHPQVMLVNTSTHLPFEYRRGADRDDIRESVVSELMRIMRPRLCRAPWGIGDSLSRICTLPAGHTGGHDCKPEHRPPGYDPSRREAGTGQLRQIADQHNEIGAALERVRERAEGTR